MCGRTRSKPYPSPWRRIQRKLEVGRNSCWNAKLSGCFLAVTHIFSVTRCSGTVPQAPWGNRPVWEGCWRGDSNWLVSIRLMEELISSSLDQLFIFARPLESSEPRRELCLHFQWFRSILGEDYELSPILFIFRDIILRRSQGLDCWMSHLVTGVARVSTGTVFLHKVFASAALRIWSLPGISYKRFLCIF